MRIDRICRATARRVTRWLRARGSHTRAGQLCHLSARYVHPESRHSQQATPGRVSPVGSQADRSHLRLKLWLMRGPISTWRQFWLSLVLGPVLLACVFAIFGPPAAQCVDEIRQARVLDSRHSSAQGVVVAHQRAWGRSPPQATVSYEVDGRQYVARLSGAGATLGALPMGRVVMVDYSPADPHLARAQVLAAATSSGSVPELALRCAGPCGLALLPAIELGQAWRRLPRQRFSTRPNDSN